MDKLTLEIFLLITQIIRIPSKKDDALLFIYKVLGFFFVVVSFVAFVRDFQCCVLICYKILISRIVKKK